MVPSPVEVVVDVLVAVLVAVLEVVPALEVVVVFEEATDVPPLAHEAKKMAQRSNGAKDMIFLFSIRVPSFY